MIVKAKDLKPGMEIDLRDLDRGPASTVVSVEVVPRPGMRYDCVRVKMADGSVLCPMGALPLVGSKFEVVK